MSSKANQIEQDFLALVGLVTIEAKSTEEKVTFYKTALLAEINRSSDGGSGDAEVFSYLLARVLEEIQSLVFVQARKANAVEFKKPYNERQLIDERERCALVSLPYLEELYLLIWKGGENIYTPDYLLAIIAEIKEFWCPQWRDKQSVQQALELLLSIYGYPVWNEEGQKKFGGAKVTNEVRSKVEEAVKKVFRDSAIRADDVSHWIRRIIMSPELVKIFIHPLLSEGDTGFSWALVEFLPVLQKFRQGFEQRNNTPLAEFRRPVMVALIVMCLDRAERLLKAHEELDRIVRHTSSRDITITFKTIDWFSSAKARVHLQVKGSAEEVRDYAEQIKESLNQWRRDYGELEVEAFIDAGTSEYNF